METMVKISVSVLVALLLTYTQNGHELQVGVTVPLSSGSDEDIFLDGISSRGLKKALRNLTRVVGDAESTTGRAAGTANKAKGAQEICVIAPLVSKAVHDCQVSSDDSSKATNPKFFSKTCPKTLG